MQQLHDLLERVLKKGTLKTNRTGTPAWTLPGGAMMQFNLPEGFPLLTTKRMAIDAIKGELCGFIRGVQSAAEFRKLGCKIWDQNANENQAWLNNPNRTGTDDLGRIYGAQWRHWNEADGDAYVDQLANVLQLITQDPTNRRIIMSAWRPDEFHLMALPPCHVLYQFTVRDGYLDLCMYQRSCDMFLGVPFNIASCAFLVHLIAHATGLRAGLFTHFLADVHIYANHVNQVEEMLWRPEYTLPHFQLFNYKASFGDSQAEFALRWLEGTDPSDFGVVGYQSHGPIKADMAV